MSHVVIFVSLPPLTLHKEREEQPPAMTRRALVLALLPDAILPLRQAVQPLNICHINLSNPSVRPGTETPIQQWKDRVKVCLPSAGI